MLSWPDTLKMAKVLPIFKSGDPEKIENYRPISIFPAFSKLYEEVSTAGVFLELSKPFDTIDH